MPNYDPSVQLLQILRGIISIFVLVAVWNRISNFFKSPKMKRFYWKIKNYLRILYRITLPHKKFPHAVWCSLKSIHKNVDWKYGVFENEKYIETCFEIAPGVLRNYYYMIYDGYFHCRVKILDDYPADRTTDLFILATHFNNLLNQGTVAINVKGGYVEYQIKTELILHIIYPGELRAQIMRHYNVSKDIFWAFNKLMIDYEEPAIIIADLLKMKDEESSKEPES